MGSSLRNKEKAMSTRYGFGKQVALAFDQAIERVTAELQKEGFGVLTDIDASATVRGKLERVMQAL